MNNWKSRAVLIASALLLTLALLTTTSHAGSRLVGAELYVVGVEYAPNGGVVWKAEVRVNVPGARNVSAELSVSYADGTTEVFGYPDIAGNFRDTAEGETAIDPYANYNFLITFDGQTHSLDLGLNLRPGESASAEIDLGKND